jgi:hypothetical protein
VFDVAKLRFAGDCGASSRFSFGGDIVTGPAWKCGDGDIDGFCFMVFNLGL